MKVISDAIALQNYFLNKDRGHDSHTTQKSKGNSASFKEITENDEEKKSLDMIVVYNIMAWTMQNNYDGQTVYFLWTY